MSRGLQMKSLTLVLIVCAALAAQSAQANDLAAIQAACADDAQRLCAGVQPGGGRVVACLKEHKDSLSDQCRQAAGLAVNPGSRPAPSAASAAPSAGTSTSGAAASAPAATSGSSAAASSSKAKPAHAPKTAPGSAEEEFTERVIADTEHNGMRAATI